MKKEIPSNVDELKTKANNKSSWRDRLDAVNELKEYDCQQSRDILTHLAIHDPVWKVKEAAFRAAQTMGVIYGGKPLKLNKKPKGNLVKGINEKLVKVRNGLGDEYSLEEFKAAFQKKYPVEYDIYDGDREDRFDKWLENVVKTLPKAKKD